MSQPIAITGANGNLGGRLIETLGEQNVRALVRSNRAQQSLIERFPNLDTQVVDYTDQQSLSAALKDCESVVHLVGILKEAKNSTYEQAHERSCETLLAALPDTIKSIVYLSIVGSEANQSNACLRSKGNGEDILLSSNVNTVVLQVPMVLGEGDYASAALRLNAQKSKATVFRGESLEQPIYAGDVVAAIQASLALEGKHRMQLAGPESVSRIELIQRAANLRGNTVKVSSLPIMLGMTVATLLELLPNPPVTRAMLGVLDHDDQVDPSEAVKLLNLELTSLDEMLRLTTS